MSVQEGLPEMLARLIARWSFLYLRAGRPRSLWAIFDNVSDVDVHPSFARRVLRVEVQSATRRA